MNTLHNDLINKIKKMLAERLVFFNQALISLSTLSKNTIGEKQRGNTLK